MPRRDFEPVIRHRQLAPITEFVELPFPKLSRKVQFAWLTHHRPQSCVIRHSKHRVISQCANAPDQITARSLLTATANLQETAAPQLMQRVFSKSV